MHNQLKKLLLASEAGDFNFRINTSFLSEEEALIANAINEAVIGYQKHFEQSNDLKNDQLATLTQEISAATAIMNSDIDKLLISSDLLKKDSDLNLSLVHESEEEVKGIMTIAKNIEQIALKIRLISLNASVEAAHAGIHGKGFSFLAEEIKTLSDNVTEQAKLIDEKSLATKNTATKITKEMLHTASLISKDEEFVIEMKNTVEALNKIYTELISLLSNSSTKQTNNSLNRKRV